MSSDNSSVDALSALESYDLSGVDTEFPVLEAGVCDFIIGEMSTERTKSGEGTNLVIKLKTAMPWKTRKGEVKQAGFPLRDSVYIPDDKTSEKGAKAWQMTQQKLAQLRLSALGSQEGAFGKTDQYIGKTVTARIKIESSTEYGDSNRIAAYVKLG